MTACERPAGFGFGGIRSTIKTVYARNDKILAESGITRVAWGIFLG